MNDKDLLYNPQYGFGILTKFSDGKIIIQYSGDEFAGYVTNLDGWQKVSFAVRAVPEDLIGDVNAVIADMVENYHGIEPPKGTRIRVKVAENDLEYHVYFRAGEYWIDEDGCKFTWKDLKCIEWEEV